MLKNNTLYLILAITFILGSCTQYKDIVYMQDIYSYKDTTSKTITTHTNGNLKLKYDDNIYINIYGNSSRALEMFNKNTIPRYNYSQYSLYMEGYSVDKDGNITLPLIGEVNVIDKTLSETQKIIQEKINEYVVGAVVEVRMLSFNITILGEVRRPGKHSFLKREINILEALGSAGDILDTGDKKNILVFRKNKDGITETFELNMTNSIFFSKNGFWLLPNDIVYVKPLRAKTIRLNSTTTSIVLSSLTTLFSAITTAILIINHTKSN